MPPFVCQLEFKNQKIYMPYLDQADNTTKYTEFYSGYFFDHNSGFDNASGMVALYAWLNKCNPDWADIASAPGSAIEGITGSGVIGVTGIIGAYVEITEGGEKLDKWWSSNDFAKYGVVCLMNNDQWQAPHQFINFPKVNIEPATDPHSAIWYAFAGGITASITPVISLAAADGTISKIPPVIVSSLFTEADIPLPPDQSPSSTYGPEVLP